MSSDHQHKLNNQPAGMNYNGGIGSGDPNDYQDWANNDFNLLAFIGEEDNGSPANHSSDHFDVTDQAEEESMDKKDMIYQNLQYNALMCEPSMEGYMDAPQGYHDPHQLATPPTYMVNNIDAALYGSAGGVNGGGAGGSGSSGTNGVRIDGSQMPSTSRAPNTMAVKVEPPSTVGDYYESESDQHSIADRHSMETDSQAGGGPMRNAYQPRKYRVKSEVEKKNPVYKVKRERNNDAVRRSRDKAKREQEMKDERLSYLEQEHLRSEVIVKRLQERNANLEKALLQMKQQCRCPARRVLP